MLNKKALAASVSAPPAPFVEDVFSTYLYTGNGSTQTITNGIDLAGEGGLVWIKSRTDGGSWHNLTDTVRGATQNLASNNTGAQFAASAGQDFASFNSNGFSLGASVVTGTNNNTQPFCSWTFRKQPKFFDIVTWTGNGESERQISHSLGVAPTVIIYKKVSGSGPWSYTQWTGTTNRFLRLNETVASSFDNVTGGYISAEPGTGAATATSITMLANGGLDLINTSGATYVAYLFASNAGGFGTAGTDNVISCGSFFTSGETTVNLGYEPQYVLVKRTDLAQDWQLYDTMRGMTVSNDNKYLEPNSSDAESSTLTNFFGIKPTATGFVAQSLWLGNGYNFIYMAIRRPMKVPTTGTSVFSPVARTGNGSSNTTVTAGFPVDMFWNGIRNFDGEFPTYFDRLRGNDRILFSNATSAEFSTASVEVAFNRSNANTGVQIGVNNNGINGNGVLYVDHFFRRAPGFMDVVCYNETANPGTYNHNLGVVPELMIHKQREATGDWRVYHKDCNTSWTYPFPILNSNLAGYYGSALFPSTPTSTTFTIDYQRGITTRTHVAYLFATLAGVSKVGSYTGNGSNQTINCGFTAGARFILIKRIDSDYTVTGDWYVWDTARGIVSGNDPHLSLNSTAAEVTSNDSVDPDNSGFIVNQLSATNINVSSATYIYLAIA